MLAASLDSLIRGAAVLIEFGGGLIAVTGCARGFAAIAASGGSHAGLRRSLLVADGIVAALGYKTAATLLKTLELQTWNAILMFAAVLALRTVVKRVLVWEKGRLLTQQG